MRDEPVVPRGEAGRLMPRLHFVYNVEATPLALISDFVHRLRSPETYPCRLCDVTYGRFLKKAEWSEYLETLPLPSKFHLRSGFQQHYPEHARDPLPGRRLRRTRSRSSAAAPSRDAAGPGSGITNTVSVAPDAT